MPSLCNLEKTRPRVLWLTSKASKKWLNPSNKIAGLVKESGLNKVDNEKVEDLIASHNEVLTAKELAPGSFFNAHPWCSSFVGKNMESMHTKSWLV